jgi:hypothetical protein
MEEPKISMQIKASNIAGFNQFGRPGATHIWPMTRARYPGSQRMDSKPSIAQAVGCGYLSKPSGLLET